jgi:acyl carrier protein
MNEKVGVKMNNSVISTVNDCIRNYIAKDILYLDTPFPHSDDASLLDQGVIDSMNILQLIMFVEKQFGLNVPDNDVMPENFDSVNRLAEYVRSKVPVPA